MSQPWAERREIGPAVLYLGDCLEVLASGALPPECSICMDPPYGIGYAHGGSGGGWTSCRNAERSREESRIIARVWAEIDGAKA